MQEYNICYSLDSNYIEQLAVSITSILKNADILDNINFYILDGGLSINDKHSIELLKSIKDFNIKFVSVNENDFKSCPLLVKKDETYKDYHVTLPTYFRFKLCEFLPNLKNILYLDCDVIIRTSLKHLFKTELKDSAVAMVIDADTEKESKRLSLEKYFNAGVMLINLDYWRNNKVENRLFDYIQNNKENILWQDQDIINVVLKNEIKELDKSWNYQYFQYENVLNDELGNISILHLAGRFKPWLMPFESSIYDEYYYYLLFTAWKNNILKYKHLSSGKYLKNQTGGSITNILVNATDEDIQKCYSSLEDNYSFVKEQLDVAEKRTDEKLSNLYNELEKSNEFVKELDKEARYLLKKSTDEKVDIVYQEITRCYKYTEKLIDEVKGAILNLKNFNTSEIENLKNDISNLKNEKSLEIENLKSEIERNNSYTEYLVEISEGKQNQKLNEVEENLNKKIQEAKTDILSLQKAQETKFTEEQLKILDEIFNENIVRINSALNKETAHRFSEVYAYSNEHFSKLYKGLTNTSSNFETILNDKVDKLYKNDETIKWDMNSIKENLNASLELVSTVDNLKKELLEQKNTNNQKLVSLQKEYEDKLNQQRIKYEKKLMHIEQTIKEDRKNPIVKFIEKIKKR